MEFVIISLFVAFSVGVIMFYVLRQKKAKKGLLDKTFLIEEEGVTINHIGSMETTVFYQCKLLYLENNLLILQKYLFGKGYRVRFNILISDNLQELDLKKSIKQNFLEFNISSDDISIINVNDRYIYVIKIPSSSLTKNQSLEFESVHKFF